jgi:hypothetical protein
LLFADPGKELLKWEQYFPHLDLYAAKTWKGSRYCAGERNIFEKKKCGGLYSWPPNTPNI